MDTATTAADPKTIEEAELVLVPGALTGALAGALTGATTGSGGFSNGRN